MSWNYFIGIERSQRDFVGPVYPARWVLLNPGLLFFKLENSLGRDDPANWWFKKITIFRIFWFLLVFSNFQCDFFAQKYFSWTRSSSSENILVSNLCKNDLHNPVAVISDAFWARRCRGITPTLDFLDKIRNCFLIIFHPQLCMFNPRSLIFKIKFLKQYLFSETEKLYKKYNFAENPKSGRILSKYFFEKS